MTEDRVERSVATPFNLTKVGKSRRWFEILGLIVISIILSIFLKCSQDIKCQFNLSSEACPKSDSKVEIRIGGSTSMIDMNYFLQENLNRDSKNISVVVLPVEGSQNGIDELINDRSDIAAISRDLTEDEKSKNLIPLSIGDDDIAVIVHRSNPVKALTSEQVKKIFQCDIKDWSQVGGIPGPIKIINRAQGSGTRYMFKKKALGDGDFCMDNDHITTLPQDASTPIVTKLIEMLPHQGIGYVSYLYAVTQEQIQPLVTIDKLKPKDEHYPYHRQLYYVYKKRHNPFIKYIQSCHGKEVLKKGLSIYSKKG